MLEPRLILFLHDIHVSMPLKIRKVTGNLAVLKISQANGGIKCMQSELNFLLIETAQRDSLETIGREYLLSQL